MNILRNLLDKYYDFRPFKSNIFNKVVGNGSKVLNFLANIILPIEFKMTKPKMDIPVATGTIICMTSFPKRIHKVWIVIECMIRQTLRAEKILLYLSKDQFPVKEILPKKLLKYEKYGFLTIILKEGNIKSYKKFWYALTDYPNKQILTVDDDALYSPKLVENVINASKKNPKCVIGSFCSWIGRDNSGAIIPYSQWVQRDMKIGDKSKDIFFGSGGGTLFPAGSLRGANRPISEIMEVCPLADDIWLNAWIRINGYEVFNCARKTGMPSIINFKNETLTSINDGEKYNDKQLFSVISYFEKKFGKNPFA